jgi:hypothetical protein
MATSRLMASIRSSGWTLDQTSLQTAVFRHKRRAGRRALNSEYRTANSQ